MKKYIIVGGVAGRATAGRYSQQKGFHQKFQGGI